MSKVPGKFGSISSRSTWNTRVNRRNALTRGRYSVRNSLTRRGIGRRTASSYRFSRIAKDGKGDT